MEPMEQKFLPPLKGEGSLLCIHENSLSQKTVLSDFAVRYPIENCIFLFPPNFMQYPTEPVFPEVNGELILHRRQVSSSWSEICNLLGALEQHDT